MARAFSSRHCFMPLNLIGRTSYTDKQSAHIFIGSFIRLKMTKGEYGNE